MKAFLYWVTRIVLILLIAFFLLMGLDVFEMPGTLTEQLVGYLIHSIPALLLLIPLFLSFIKRMKATGIVCIVLAIAGFFFFNADRNLVVLGIVTGLPLLIGCAFLYEGKQK